MDNPELCIDRVKSRVLKGGHPVPKADIVRRFYRSKANFWNNFTKLVDKWYLFYNGDEGFQQVATGNDRSYSIENQLLLSLFKTNMDEKS